MMTGQLENIFLSVHRLEASATIRRIKAYEWHGHLARGFLAIILCSTAFLLTAVVPARAGCDIRDIVEKYAESETTEKYGRREELRVEIARFAKECAEELPDRDVLNMAGLAYEYGIFDEAQPLAKRIYSMKMNEVEDTALALAAYSSDEGFLAGLIKVQLRDLEERGKALADYKRGAYKLDVGRYLAAVSGFEEEMALRRRVLGWLLMCYGDAEAAVGEYEAVMEDEPDFWITPAQLGTRYLETGDLDRAGFFSKYSLSHRDGARAYSNLARIAVLRGDTAAARRYADKIAGISEAYFNLETGRLELLDGNYIAALEYFKNFFDTSPCVTADWNHEPLFAAYNLLGKLIDANGNIPDEKTMFETGRRFEALGEFRAAAPYFYLLTMISPRNPEYYYRLGLCNERLGMNYSAVAAYSLHLLFAPGSDRAAEITEYFDSRVFEFDAVEK